MYGSGACKIHNTIKGESWCQDNSYTVIKFSHVIFAWVLQSIWCLIASSCFFIFVVVVIFLILFWHFEQLCSHLFHPFRTIQLTKKGKRTRETAKKRKRKLKKFLLRKQSQKRVKLVNNYTATYVSPGRHKYASLIPITRVIQVFELKAMVDLDHG